MERARTCRFSRRTSFFAVFAIEPVTMNFSSFCVPFTGSASDPVTMRGEEYEFGFHIVLFFLSVECVAKNIRFVPAPTGLHPYLSVKSVVKKFCRSPSFVLMKRDVLDAALVRVILDGDQFRPVLRLQHEPAAFRQKQSHRMALARVSHA